MNFEQIVGHKIKSIYLLVDNEIINLVSIEQILIETYSNKILISVNKDFDEVILKVDKSLSLDSPNSYQSIIKVTNDSGIELNDLLNKKIIWTWTLTNNQGYDDAFQIEVNDNNVYIIYQFLTIASSIKIYKLKDVQIPIVKNNMR